MKKSQKRKIVGSSALGVIGIALIAFNLGVGMNFGKIANKFGTSKTTGDYTSADCFNNGVKANTEIEEEGATLLVNKDNLLPLSGQKVTILGACSHNYVQGGTGSAGGKDDQNTVMLDTVLGNAGIDYNKDAWTWMDNALGLGLDSHNATVNTDYLSATDKERVKAFNWTDYNTIHEFSADTYNEFVTDKVIGDYTDVALVTFGRSGAEGASPSLDYDGNYDTTTGRDYLELTDEEKDLLKFCKSKFKHTIVLINSAEPMECGFANNKDYNVDGVLWIGHPGEAGINAVGSILNGTVNPSGHTVDTWTYDMTTNPTFYSANDQAYNNVTGANIGSKNKYYEYNEGIYLGYRYFETADAAGYFDSDIFKTTKFKGNLSEGKYYSELSDTVTYDTMKTAGPQATYSGYGEVVQFPFGYGLSYTTFKQEIASSDVKLTAHGENKISVKVTNTGNVAGKGLAQIYMEAPYAQDSTLGIAGVGLEKPKMVLVGFAKTDTLKPGASQVVDIPFSTDEMATFDEFGKGYYVLEKGDYIFHVAQNAHSWNADDDATYGKDYATVKASVTETKVYDDERVITVNGVTVTEGKVARNCMNDITAGDGAMLVSGGASGTYKYGYLSRKDFAAGMKEIMSYQSNDYIGKFSGNGYVWSADGTGTTALVNGGKVTATVGGGWGSTGTEMTLTRRNAGTAVATAITTTPTSLTDANGVNNGMDYNYGSLLASGITFGDGKTTKKIYGYGNDAAINEAVTRDGKATSDASYLNSDAGNEIKFGASYYVAEADGKLVKADDGYLAIFDTEADAAAKGTARKLMAADMAGVPDDDLTRWDKLANELTFNEADDLMGINSWQEVAAESVGKPHQLAIDGPGEAGNAQHPDRTWWNCACIIAATFNPDMAKMYGVNYGEQDLLNGVNYCYSPAMNTHRSPFGGRCFEYYSEDGFLAGITGGWAITGIQSTGMHVFTKHMALNDSDTNRNGVSTFADETSIREIYAKPYEIATKYFKADGIMGSLNSLGISWSHSGFYQDLCRDEWKWHGMLITDGDGSTSDSYNQYSFWTFGAEGGLLGSGSLRTTSAYQTVTADTASNYTKYMLHIIGRNALYQYAHNYDALGVQTVTVPNKAVPMGIMIGVDAVLVLAAAGVACWAFIPRKKKVTEGAEGETK